ncbi:MAG: carbon-nitrogen hydrolase family protein [Candidatus Pacearchaeota archaeon]
MNNKFKVAAVQLRIDQSDKEIIEDIERYIKKAKKKGAKIICFPEDTFYSGPKRNEMLLEQVKKSCKEHKIWAILAAHFKEKKYVYNEAILISDRGKKIGEHKKVHVYDSYHIHSGSRFDIFNTPFCQVGLAICWDISCPKSIQEMARKGAKIIFCPMYWCYENWSHKEKHEKLESALLRSLILTRAFENQVYFVFCNPYDKSEPTLVSHTMIAEPHRILAEIQHKPGIIFAEIDLDHLKRIRKAYLKECKWKTLREFLA